MKYNFNRRRLESISSFLLFYLLLFSLALWTLYRADAYFNWDIIPDSIQRFIDSFLINILIGVIVFCFITSIILNLGLISISMERLVDAQQTQPNNTGSEIEIGNSFKKIALITISALVVLLLIFNFYNKWHIKHQFNQTTDNLIEGPTIRKIESALDHFNYGDSLDWRFNAKPSYYYNRDLYNEDSAFGIANINSYKELKSLLSEALNTNDQDMKLYSTLYFQFNDKWIIISNEEAATYKEHADVELLPKSIFKVNNLGEVKTINKNGYQIQYRIGDRIFDMIIFLKTKHPAVIHLQS